MKVGWHKKLNQVFDALHEAYDALESIRPGGGFDEAEISPDTELALIDIALGTAGNALDITYPIGGNRAEQINAIGKEADRMKFELRNVEKALDQAERLNGVAPHRTISRAERIRVLGEKLAEKSW